GELLDLRIELLGQNDLQRDVFIAGALVAARHALAPQPEHASGIRPLGYRHAHRPARGGAVELRAKHRLRQADRQFDVDVVALARENLVRGDLDLDQGVAGRTAAEPGSALAAQPQHLLVPGAGREDHVERAAVRQRDALGGAVHRLEALDREPVERFLAAHAEAALAATGTAEQVLEDVLVHEIGVAARVAVGVLLGVGTVEIAVVALAWTLVAGGVDLAAVEARPLVGVAADVIGGGDLLEPLFRPLVAGIEVRVQLLRQRAVGGADLVLRGLRLHAQHGIGILAHVALLFR